MTQEVYATIHSPVCVNHFTGKERDTELGLDYFGARYYASSMGRWMSPDYSMNSVILELPQSWNKYSYVLNRPTYARDYDGRCPWCVGAVVGAVAEGGFDLGKQLYNKGGAVLSNTDPNMRPGRVTTQDLKWGVQEATQGVNNHYSKGFFNSSPSPNYSGQTNVGAAWHWWK